VPQKKSYIDAVLCLSHRKAKSGIAGAVNRFDDHQGVHMLQKPQIHWVVCQVLLIQPRFRVLTTSGSFPLMAPLLCCNL
jgi:hypothetical protein